MIVRTALFASFLWTAIAQATPADEPAGSGRVTPPPLDGAPMAFIGLARQPCATFVAVAEQERKARGEAGVVGPDDVRTVNYGAFLSWADGYLTARNETAAARRTIGAGSTHEQRGRWMELFCRANSEAPFFTAVFRLRDYLLERGDGAAD